MTEEKTNPETVTNDSPTDESVLETAGSETTDTEPTTPTPTDDPEEPIRTWESLGPAMFDVAMASLKPQRIIIETQRGDRATFFRNFKGHRLDKFNRKRMNEILRKEIFGRRNLFMAQLAMLLWNDTKKDLYTAIHKHVMSINENVEAIERIDDHKAHEIMNDLLAHKFSRDDIYICVRINDVRFSPEFINNHVAPRTFEAEELAESAAEANAESAAEPTEQAAAE